MVINDQIFRQVYICDGVQTVFPITFEASRDTLGNAQNIAVRWSPNAPDVPDQDLQRDVDFTVNGMNVVISPALAAADRIAIYRRMDLKQLVSFLGAGAVDLRVLEGSLDKLTFISQQLQEQLNRIFRAPVTDLATNLELPNETDRANRFLGFDALGNFMVYSVPGVSPVDISAYTELSLLWRTSAEAWRNELDVYQKNDVYTKAEADARIIALAHPVNSIYVQYPTEPSNTLSTAFPASHHPGTLFGGSWTLLWNGEGVFFRTEGTGATADNTGRSNGRQQDQMQRVTGDFGNDAIRVHLTSGTNNGAFSRQNYGAAGPIGSGTGCRYFFNSANSPNARASATNNGETRPVNRLMRVYRRTS